ncbi:uncharacterized protein K444DRAFT_21114 [Hyaloscypha bicolor E]|uniref:Uncharacterized protein n=1 Tax=Hyaloscypha bicolor E TaxID=1095630 RepID=A0A2J6T4V1_9HELO|nr:uncharacterized protein K444DRAFT_21114 [Hyaloscypha bicolor E]PMD58050.1 hypothetical protein K444DRAFT_21114 [Hyaloscypha bicolor E]
MMKNDDWLLLTFPKSWRVDLGTALALCSNFYQAGACKHKFCSESFNEVKLDLTRWKLFPGDPSRPFGNKW